MHAVVAPTIPVANPKLVEKVLDRTAYGHRVYQTPPQEQWQRVRRKTFTQRFGDCIVDHHMLPGKDSAHPLPRTDEQS